MTTRLRLLGRARVFDGQRWLEAPHDKRFGLLAYLATAGDPVKREQLAFLFWPDVEEPRARRDLRHLIYRTKALGYASDLETRPDSLSWPVATDARSFSQAVAEREWAAAVALYGGELLQGLHLDDSPEFMSWLDLERENLHALWRGAVIERAAELEGASQHREACALLGELVEDDELDEDALRLYLHSSYLGGRREEGLVAYQRFAHKLQAELQLEPLPATRELVAALRGGHPLARSGSDGSGQAAGAATRAPPRRLRNFPAESTPFIGREIELAEVIGTLNQAACRLLTLVGPGGIGKTRLAQEAAVAVAAGYGDGVAFVPLASVGNAAWLASAIASALSLSFYDPREPEAQLIGYLADKEMLLLLDNLEHLPAGFPFVSDLLAACPRLRVVATSRERLNLTREWLYHVGGMSLPGGESADGPEGSDAVQLFLRCARRVSDIRLDEEDRASVVRICHLVGGAPLGIELAAGWLEMLSCREIAEKMAEGLDFLASPLHDMPERHRSLRRVFEHSWQLLTEEERSAFKRLSVFRGGFGRKAAEEVTGVSTRTLRSLLEKSLITRDRSGRFDLHELVKQYAAEKLGETREEEHERRDRHTAFYAAFLNERDRWMKGGERQRASLQEIGREMDNVRSAWEWAVRRRDTEALEAAASCFRFYCQTRGLYQEGEEAFRLAVDSLAQESVTYGKLLLFQGLFTHWQGRYAAAQEIAERSLGILERQAAPPGVMSNANMLLGIIHRLKGEPERAKHQFSKTLALARQGGEAFFEARALQGLGAIAESEGALDEAERWYRQCIAIYRRTEERYGMALALYNLGRLLERLGQFEAARLHYLEGLDAASALGSRLRIAEAHILLGGLSYDQGQYQEAEAHYSECLSVVRERNDEPFRVAARQCLAGLGESACALGKHRESFHYFDEALKAALGANDAARITRIVVGLADLLATVGQDGMALALVAFSLAQADIEDGTRRRAERLEAGLTVRLPQAAVVSAQEQGRALRIAEVTGLLGDWQQQFGG